MVNIPQGVQLNQEVDDFAIAVDAAQHMNLPEVKSEPTDFLHEPQSQQSYESGYLHQDIDHTEVKIEPTEISDEPIHYQTTYDNTCETHQNQESAVASNSGTWGRMEISMPHEKSQPQERYSCAECGYHSQYKANLYRHIRLRQHSILQTSQHQDGLKIRQRRRLTLDEILANSNASEMKVYTCNVCGYKTAFKGNADRHQRSQNHHGIDVSIYGRNRSRMDCLMSQRLKYAPDGNYQPTISTTPHVMQPQTESSSQQQQHCLNQAERELLQEIREEFMKINACNSSGMDLFD